MTNTDDYVPRLKALVGEHGFAQLEAFNEQLRKNPPSKERMDKILKKLLKRDPALGLPSLDSLKKDLFGDGA